MRLQYSSHLFRSLMMGGLTAGCMVAVGSAFASPVHYYRFEDGSVLDDSIGTLDLVGTPSVTMSIGSFDNPIPATGDPNGQALTGSALTGNSAGVVAGSDSLTVEGYFNTSVAANTSNGQQTLVAQWAASPHRTFRVNLQAIDGGDQNPGGDDTYRLRSVIRQENNTEFSMTSTGLTINANTDYYFAFVFDNAADAYTFYLKDLTNNGALLTSSGTQGFGGFETNGGALSAPVSIGSNGTQAEGFTGRIDEVRLSNSALTANDLLVVPEPGSMGIVDRRRTPDAGPPTISVQMAV